MHDEHVCLDCAQKAKRLHLNKAGKRVFNAEAHKFLKRNDNPVCPHCVQSRSFPPPTTLFWVCISSCRWRAPLHAHPCFSRFSGSVPPIVAARVLSRPHAGVMCGTGTFNYSAVCKYALCNCVCVCVRVRARVSHTVIYIHKMVLFPRL